MELQMLWLCSGRLTLADNGWRYGLVKADHYRPIEEQNFKQPLLTIPHIMFSCGGKNRNKMGMFDNLIINTDKLPVTDEEKKLIGKNPNWQTKEQNGCANLRYRH